MTTAGSEEATLFTVEPLQIKHTSIPRVPKWTPFYVEDCRLSLCTIHAPIECMVRSYCVTKSFRTPSTNLYIPLYLGNYSLNRKVCKVKDRTSCWVCTTSSCSCRQFPDWWPSPWLYQTSPHSPAAEIYQGKETPMPQWTFTYQAV